MKRHNISLLKQRSEIQNIPKRCQNAKEMLKYNEVKRNVHRYAKYVKYAYI